jgi:hypothetical protein
MMSYSSGTAITLLAIADWFALAVWLAWTTYKKQPTSQFNIKTILILTVIVAANFLVIREFIHQK